MDNQEQNYVVLPPTEVFEISPTFDNDELFAHQGAEEQDGWIETICPSTGGMFSRNEGKLYLRKGHPYPQAIIANNQVKRVFLLLGSLASFIKPKGYITRVIDSFNRFAEVCYNSIVPHPFLKKQYYNNCSRELWDIVVRFLTYIKVEEPIAIRTGRIIATMFEYDEAYRLRIEDIFSETTKEKLYSHPIKEIRRLFKIFVVREHAIDISKRIKTILIPTTFLLLIPKFRRAFRFAISNSNFKNLQLDDNDIYYCLKRPEYDFLGESINKRYARFLALHPELLPESIRKSLGQL